MSDAAAKRVAFSPILYMALSVLLWPRTGLSALPPATVSASEEKSGASQAAAVPVATSADAGTEYIWVFPPVQWGGMISYDMRSNSGEGQDSMQRGLMATLKATTYSNLWQAWIGRVSGNLAMTTSRSNSSSSSSNGGSGDFSSRNVSLSGSGQLSLFPISRFPFEAHISRTNSMTSSDLSLPLDYVSQQFGFSQRYQRVNGQAMFGYDRSTQSSGSIGGTRQDNVQMSFSQNLNAQHFLLTGNGSKNTSDGSSDFVRQGNLTLQHDYTPSTLFSVGSMGNISTSDYHLAKLDSDTRLSQLSSQAFWHASERPLSLTGGARLMTMTATGSGDAITGGTQSTRLSAANANIGGSYDFSQYFHINAAANVNVSETRDRRIVNGNQFAGASYTPEARQIGGFTYSWSASGSVNNQSGGNSGGHQMGVQFGHGVNRNFVLESGASLSMDASQSISATKNSLSLPGDPAPTKLITHSAGLGWSHSEGASSAMARLSASDSRGLNGNREYFQMLNLQLTNNLQTGSYTSWSGSLTMQKTWQGGLDMAFPSTINENGLSGVHVNTRHDTSTTSSGGSVSYQNSRLFGVRNLRFSSDLRLNSQGLLPIMGSVKDQEAAAWENRFTYSIGRTQLRLSTIVARVTFPSYSKNADGNLQINGTSRTNRAIMLSVMRSFGDF